MIVIFIKVTSADIDNRQEWTSIFRQLVCSWFDPNLEDTPFLVPATSAGDLINNVICTGVYE